MELIDTHCHLTFEQLAWEIDEVVERSIAAGVIGWITVGTDSQEDRKAVDLAERFENMYAAVGVHPHEAKNFTGETVAELKELAGSQKVIAIGETGLDFHYNFSNQSAQRRAFAAQLKIARELHLPVIIHCREAFADTMDILEQFTDFEGRLVVFHCFSGTVEQAKTILDHGFYISLTGVVTFRNAGEIRRAAKIIPTDRLMLETDCPYMSPEPMRKRKINEPALMIQTANHVAELKEMYPADFAKAVTATSKSFFGLG
ncbi:MAG: TatD family hydrolase [Phycisphaerales bacterium]|nr:MAG: TatD family hydrolase [Phycisphaerales bacterium]